MLNINSIWHFVLQRTPTAPNKQNDNEIGPMQTFFQILKNVFNISTQCSDFPTVISRLNLYFKKTKQFQFI